MPFPPNPRGSALYGAFSSFPVLGSHQHTTSASMTRITAPAMDAMMMEIVGIEEEFVVDGGGGRGGGGGDGRGDGGGDGRGDGKSGGDTGGGASGLGTTTDADTAVSTDSPRTALADAMSGKAVLICEVIASASPNEPPTVEISMSTMVDPDRTRTSTWAGEIAIASANF